MTNTLTLGSNDTTTVRVAFPLITDQFKDTFTLYPFSDSVTGMSKQEQEWGKISRMFVSLISDLRRFESRFKMNSSHCVDYSSINFQVLPGDRKPSTTRYVRVYYSA